MPSLPKPTEQEIALSNQLKALIIERIENAGGWLDFADFMQMALYQPGLGYYQNALHKFGEAGDFITAPEMGDVFAQAIANSIVGLIDEAATLNILELGAGSGALAAALISQLNAKGVAVSYHILEPSAFLQAQQKDKLQAAQIEFSQVRWLSQWPDAFSGVVIANEVIDALPVSRYIMHQGLWHQLGIGVNEDALTWQIGEPVQAPLPSVLEYTEDYCEDYRLEWRGIQKHWLQGLSNALQSAAVLLIDYGYNEQEYFHPERFDGTLMGFYRHHQTTDVLQWPGLLDITAHVNFTQLARDAMSAGFDILGYTHQRGFLLECGQLQQLEQSLQNANAEQRIKMSQQLLRLMLPGQMGDRVKLLCLGREQTKIPMGFSQFDELHRL